VQLFLDDKVIDQPAPEVGTLDEALRQVQSDLAAARRILVAFACDGEEMVGAAMVEALRKPASSYERVDLFSSTPADLVRETMDHASTSLDQTEIATQEVAQMLIQGRSTEAIAQLGDCLRVWQQVHDAVSKSLSLLEIDPAQATIRDESMEAALIRPKEVLVQIKQALLAQDHVLLADLLQYEFAEVAELWRQLIARLSQAADDLQAASPQRSI